MQFYIEVKSGYRTKRILVHLIYRDERIERFMLIGKDRSITLESNRPMFRNRGLKHRKPNWKVVEGEAYQGNTLDEAVKEIMKVVDHL